MRSCKAREGFGPHLQEGRVKASEHRDARWDDRSVDRGHHTQCEEGRTGRLLQLDQQVRGTFLLLLLLFSLLQDLLKTDDYFKEKDGTQKIPVANSLVLR